MLSQRSLKSSLIAALVVVAACGSDSTAPSGPLNIAGAWTLNLNISNSQLAASCTAQNVVVVFTQTGSTFTGTASSGNQICSGGGTSQSNSLAGTTWSGGQVNGTSVSFASQGGCSITGTVTGNPPNHMSGSLACPLAINGSTFTFTGTWTGSR